MKWLPSPLRGWRMKEREIDDNEEFVNECLRLWEQGLDTKEIADRTFQWEHIVERTIHRGRERRRREE
jgi:hypothetical protein